MTSRFRPRHGAVVVWLALLVGAVALVVPARAAFPGKNGRIAFLREHKSGGQTTETIKPSGRGRKENTRTLASAR